MSGGSMDYFYGRLEDAANQFQRTTPERIALRTHMLKLACVLKAVEWNDSGDGDDEEERLLRELLTPQEVLVAARDEARRVLADLQKVIAQVGKS